MQGLQLVGYLCCVAAACALFVRLVPGAGWRAYAIVLGLTQAGLALLLLRDGPAATDAPIVQTGREQPAYATSSLCQSCHPGEYATWHRSFHRTMTSVASPENVRAPWDGVHLTWRGRSYELFRKGDEFWARLPDPDLTAQLLQGGRDWTNAPSVERRIEMTTGSHHYQAFWVLGQRGNELWQFPFVYHFESQRFIPRDDAFLQPPDAKPHRARWNSNCIQCHAVMGQPAHDEASDRFESSVVELGIACEACHGPGRQHAERHKNPVTRYRQRASEAADPTIVNPARLAPDRAAAVCGQCHSYFVPRDPKDWWQHGFAAAFRPGDSLEASRLILDYARDRERPEPVVSASIESIFFPDGTIRVGGREYNGLVLSPCYERGRGDKKLTCLSCHAMHGDEPIDQLKPEQESNGHCLACHTDFRSRSETHTHHAAGSPGSACYDCHMPYTSYALFKGIRSHRITSPNATTTTQGVPNACNLCHLDKSLGWTAEHLKAWYGQNAPPLSADEERLAHAVVALLQGDAATRVLHAYSTGSAEAQQASGKGWQAVPLSLLLDDPYSAVRFVAYRSLRSLPGFSEFSYDFLAPPAQRKALSEQAYRRASSLRSGLSYSRETLDRLIANRDTTPISISE